MISRPAEHQHTRHCVTKAMISAIEYLRDAHIADFDFAIEMQDNNAYHNAHHNLETGNAMCICPPCVKVCCEHLVGEGENIQFKHTAHDPFNSFDPRNQEH